MRVNVTLNPSTLERARAVVNQLPGASVSALIDEALSAILPAMEAMVRIKDQAKEVQEEAFSKLLADQLLGLAEDGVTTMRILKKGVREA